MKKQKQQLNLTAFFVLFAVIGAIATAAIVNVLGLDFWNWPTVPVSAGMSAVETAENLETQTAVMVFFLGILMTIGMPIVATAAVDLYFGPK